MWHFSSAWSHHRLGPGLFLFSLVLEMGCLRCDFHPFGKPSLLCCMRSSGATHRSSPPLAQPLATEVGKHTSLKQ